MPSRPASRGPVEQCRRRRTAEIVQRPGSSNAQRRNTRTPASSPSGATATQVGDAPNGFLSCFQEKNASFGSPSTQPNDARHNPITASRSEGVDRRIVSSSVEAASGMAPTVSAVRRRRAGSGSGTLPDPRDLHTGRAGGELMGRDRLHQETFVDQCLLVGRGRAGGDLVGLARHVQGGTVDLARRDLGGIADGRQSAPRPRRQVAGVGAGRRRGRGSSGGNEPVSTSAASSVPDSTRLARSARIAIVSSRPSSPNPPTIAMLGARRPVEAGRIRLAPVPPEPAPDGACPAGGT